MDEAWLEAIPVLDQAALAGLRDLLGTEFEALLISCSEELAAQIDTLGQALDARSTAGPAPAVTEAAHTLKGASGNLGCARLSALAAELEQEARGRAPSRIPPEQAPALLRHCGEITLAALAAFAV